MNQKLTDLKKKIKKAAPIVISTATAIVATAYILKYNRNPFGVSDTTDFIPLKPEDKQKRQELIDEGILHLYVLSGKGYVLRSMYRK